MRKILTGFIGSISLYFFFLAVFPLTTVSQSASAESKCAITEQIFPELVKVRGLALKQSVGCVLQNKPEVLSFVTGEAGAPESVERMKYLSIILKSLKVLAEDFNYEKEFIALLTEQIGGYYDPKKKRYVMASWLPDSVQPTIAAHELTHALQDQYYDLKPFTDERLFSTDNLLARAALIEGDATLTMHDYVRSTLGGPSVTSLNSVDDLILQTVVGMHATTSSGKMPQTIISMLIFPYTSGLRFAHAVAKEGGYKKIDAAFKAPPVSTQEILHPEIYIKRINAGVKNSAERPDTKQVASDEALFIDTFGEFFLTNWIKSLGVTTNQASSLGAAWSSDSVRVLKTKKVVWSIAFDSKVNADLFVAALKGNTMSQGWIIEQDIDRGVTIRFT